MSAKEINRAAAEKLLMSPWWQPEYADLISPEMTIEFPNAVPGMPQNMDAFDAKLFRKWMTATVKNWSVELIELYGTPDEGSFWAVSEVSADVHWGGKDGHFASRRFDNLLLKDGVLVKLRELTNPLKWLEAIGAEVPIFRMDLMDQRIDDFMAASTGEAHNPVSEDIPSDPESVRQRIQNCLDAYRQPGYWDAVGSLASYAPDATSAVWFLPPEMGEEYPAEMMPRVEAWSVLSCPVIDFDESGVSHATDDPYTWFCEYKCSGVTDWIGNNAPNSRYRNRYWYILRFDKLGRISRCEEILNPVNKFNSIGVSIPTFPYYY